MPDFEVVHRCVIVVDEPYVTEDSIRAGVQALSVREVGRVNTLPNGITYRIKKTNDVAVKKLSS